MHVLSLHCDLVCQYSLLASILRAIPPTSDSVSEVSDNCISVARDALDMHQQCVESARNFKRGPFMVTRYINWSVDHSLQSCLFSGPKSSGCPWAPLPFSNGAFSPPRPPQTLLLTTPSTQGDPAPPLRALQHPLYARRAAFRHHRPGPLGSIRRVAAARRGFFGLPRASVSTVRAPLPGSAALHRLQQSLVAGRPDSDP